MVRGYWERAKSRGVRLSTRRFREELISPQHGWSKNLSFGVRPFRRFFRPRQEQNSLDVCYSVYDLNLYPTSFDFAYFLALAEIYARKSGLRRVFVVFVPRGNVHLTSDESNLYSEDAVKWRFENILIPLTHMSPFCTGYALFNNEADAYDFVEGRVVFPEKTSHDYKPRFSISEVFSQSPSTRSNVLEAPKKSLEYIRNWLDANEVTDPIVTITIRARDVDATRNSNLQTWMDFASWLKSKSYAPVFIPDTDAAWSMSFKGFLTLTEAAFNLALRQGMYESSFTNFFMTNGPAAGAVLNKDVSYVMTGLLTTGSEYSSPAEWDTRGVSIGSERFTFAESHQLILWDPPTVETLMAVFTKIEREIAIL